MHTYIEIVEAIAATLEALLAFQGVIQVIVAMLAAARRWIAKRRSAKRRTRSSKR